MKFPLRYNRRFKVWSYQVSHNVLLLRSNSGRGFVDRVDVMFRDVAAFRLRRTYENLAVDLVPASDAFGLLGGDMETVEFDSYVFSVGAVGGVSGFVVAGTCHFAEDDMEYGEPSAIDHSEFASRVTRSGNFP
ncbi:hypothetical protein J2S43_001888 [Catenuloplanes nepalensis]|uniref:Uncharacterized protein n=1 Tax=Catenuloplanes nepalensis TaxID=587533 RepID=A0ABT9MPN3_9ACTN|nr:hypothetical protein [Catenuloplanes nepalensis]MDP9793376.1 hypothetical protein [Catenuloplanes nepalensis]